MSVPDRWLPNTEPGLQVRCILKEKHPVRGAFLSYGTVFRPPLTRELSARLTGGETGRASTPLAALLSLRHGSAAPPPSSEGGVSYFFRLKICARNRITSMTHRKADRMPRVSRGALGARLASSISGKPKTMAGKF